MSDYPSYSYQRTASLSPTRRAALAATGSGSAAGSLAVVGEPAERERRYSRRGAGNKSGAATNAAADADTEVNRDTDMERSASRDLERERDMDRLRTRDRELDRERDRQDHRQRDRAAREREMDLDLERELAREMDRGGRGHRERLGEHERERERERDDTLEYRPGTHARNASGGSGSAGPAGGGGGGSTSSAYPGRSLAELELDRVGLGLAGDTSAWEDYAGPGGELSVDGVLSAAVRASEAAQGQGEGAGAGAGEEGDHEPHPDDADADADADAEMSFGSLKIPEGYVLVPGNKVPSSGKALKAGSVMPLKRGSACLHCRKRKLRCNAQKPRCGHCIKGNHVCEYDVGKPRSRVKALEAKIAELETKLHTTESPEPAQAAAPPAASSFNLDSTMDYEHAFNGAGGSFPYDDPYQQGNLTVSDLAAAAALAPPMPMPGASGEGARDRRTSQSKAKDAGADEMPIDPRLNSLADYGVMNGAAGEQGQQAGGGGGGGGGGGTSFLRSTNQHDQYAPANFAYSNFPRDTSYIDALVPSLPYADFAAMAAADQPAGMDLRRRSSANEIGSSDGSEAWANMTLPSFDFNFMDPSFAMGRQRGETGDTPHSTSSVSASIPAGSKGMSTQPTPEQKQNGGTSFETELYRQIFGDDLGEDWYPTTELPDQARDKLLDLYFTRMIDYGMQVDRKRFWERMAGPPADQPHPCMLNAMYLIVARFADDKKLSRLESHFYQKANDEFTEGMKTADRLVDLTRGAALVSIYLFSQARYHEALVSTGRLVRLATCCGLHQISSSTVAGLDSWSKMTGGSVKPYIRSRQRYALEPPKDDLDLGERIQVFWQVYYLDRAGAIATGWSPSLPEDEIITPFMHHLSAYSKGVLKAGDDGSISSLYEESYYSIPRFEDDITTLRTKAMVLLYNTSRLLMMKPEPGVNMPSTPGGSMTNTPDTPEGEQGNYRWWMTPRYRTPRRFAEVEKAVKLFIANLPPRFKDPMRPKADGDGFEVDIEALSLNTYIAVCCMYLEDIDDYRCENKAALAAARRCLAMIHAIPEEQYHTLELYLSMLWSYLGQILVKEAKRLRRLGEAFAASSVEVEIDVVIKAQKRVGKVYGLASTQAVMLEQMKKAPVPEVIREADEA